MAECFHNVLKNVKHRCVRQTTKQNKPLGSHHISLYRM